MLSVADGLFLGKYQCVDGGEERKYLSPCLSAMHKNGAGGTQG